MEFLEGNPEVAKKAQQLKSKFEEQVKDLQKRNIDVYRRQIEEAADLQDKSRVMRKLLETNLPASALVLDKLLESDKKEPIKYLEWMFHRCSVTMALESFTKARSLAEKAHVLAKELYADSIRNYMDPNVPRKSAYKAYSKACVNLLFVCRYQGKISDAEVVLKEAKSAAVAECDVEEQHLLQILEGDILLARGQLNHAIDNFFMPLLRTQNISDSNKGILLQKLGNACRSAARWGDAKDYLRKSIRIAQDLEDKIAEYDRSTDLGNVYRSEGRIDDALKQQIPHMSFAYNRGDLWGLTVACFNMGFAYYSITPHPDLKRALILLSLKFELASRTDNEPLRGMSLNNLGKVFCALNEHEMALKVMTQSVEVAKKTLNVAGEGMAYGNIGTAYRSLRRYEEAIVNHTKYLKNASSRGDDGGVAIMQRELAIDYICKGDLEQAEIQVRDAISTLENIRNKLGGEDSSKIANFDKNQAETYSLLQVILVRRDKVEEALAMSELARSRALTDLIREKLVRTSDKFRGAPTSSWFLCTDFATRWEKLADEILADYKLIPDILDTNFLVYSVVKDYDAKGVGQQWLYIWLVLNDSSETGQEKIHFRRVLLSEALPSDLVGDPSFFSSLTRSFRQTSTEENQSTFPVSKVILENGEDKQEEEDFQAVPKLIESQDVQELLEIMQSLSLSTPVKGVSEHTTADDVCHRNVSKEPTEPQTETKDEKLDEMAEMCLERYIQRGSWNKEGFKRLLLLYRICIEPIEGCLPRGDKENVPKITIIPHEFLFSVPFCCLHDGKTQYFVERFVLNYVPSLRAFHLLNDRLLHLKLRMGRRKMKVLAMGDPEILLPNIDRLPSSGIEARNVVSVFGSEQCRLAVREEATKELLLSELKNVDILHVATHASPEETKSNSENVQADYSMRGCLILASSNYDCDGIVTASEIAATDCTCQLVNLSCCETGLGKVTGDGVVGLYRAFIAAGAASVLVTLWKIRDDVTPVFMQKFYTEFKASGNVSSSLRFAMLFCIHEEKLPPQQWAAFSLIGADSS